jgi:hypothetical protein
LLQPLPLIAQGLTDANSLKVVSAYDAALLTNYLTVLDVLDAAKRAVPVPEVLSGEFLAWLDAILDVKDRN